MHFQPFGHAHNCVFVAVYGQLLFKLSSQWFLW